MLEDETFLNFEGLSFESSSPMEDMRRELAGRKTKRTNCNKATTSCDTASPMTAIIIAGAVVVIAILMLVLVATKNCKKKFKCARIVKCCCKGKSKVYCCG